MSSTCLYCDKSIIMREDIMNDSTANNQCILGHVQTSRGSIAVKALNDVFVNYMFSQEENNEILRSLVNILIDDLRSRYVGTSVSPVRGDITVETQYAHLKAGTPRRQDAKIIGDDITYVEFQSISYPPEPIRLRAVEYFTLSLSTDMKGGEKVVRQIWVLSKDVEELMHGSTYANYVWMDEITHSRYPADYGMLFVCLGELEKDHRSKAGELAAFLLGKADKAKHREVADIVDAYNASFEKFREDKEAVTLMSYTEEREAIGEAKGKAIGIEETNAKTALKMLAKGMDMDDIEDITGLSSEAILAMQKKAADEQSDSIIQA